MKVNGKEALVQLLQGKKVEAFDRYYRYNKDKNIVEYSDNTISWKESSMEINYFLQHNDWNV